MASHNLKRKAEELSALVDRINTEIGAGLTGKKSRLDYGLTPKTKAELLKAFVDQHLNENDDVNSTAPDSPVTTLDQVTETPIVLDREAFLKRLQTYSALFTYGKPITPVECARHGWIDTRQYQTDHLVSKLRCELCSGVVYVTDVKHGASEELLHSIREKYLKGLSGLHDKNCIWKYSECDEWVYSFPFYTSYDAVKQWQENLNKIIASNITLPAVQSPLTPENLNLLEKLLKLEHELDNSGPAADWLKHSQLAGSLILPLFGWNLHIIEERPLLKCDLCFRALGLWNYNNTDSTINFIDAEKEHRPYCPWINRSQAQITSTMAIPYSSQKSATSVCGWEFMLNTITIECKHLEEMYDLSPKAEQQRRKLHNEAQMLMKAAKFRLAEVLNGKWMKEVAASPVTNRASEPPNEQIAQEPAEQEAHDISEGEAEQLNESVLAGVQKTSHDNEKLADDLVQATADTTDMEFSENTDQVQLESTTEEMIEAPASPHIPVEVTVSIDENNQQESEVLAGEANFITNVATPELQVLEIIRDSAKLGSPGSSLDVNLSTYSSPRHDLVEIDVSAAADEEVPIGISEQVQAVTGTEEEISHAEEPVIEVEQDISQSLESENTPQELEATAPASDVSQVEESDVKQQISEVDENLTDVNVSAGNLDTTENADLTETIESQLADEAQISAFDTSETINQYEAEHIEEQVQEQVKAQEASSAHVANLESTVVDEEIQAQMTANADYTDDTFTVDNVAKETGQEGIEVENSHAEEIDVDVNEVLVDDLEKTYDTSDELNEVQQDVTHDTRPEEETIEKPAVHETIESANENDAEPHEHTIEESDVQQVIENESMAVDLTGNDDEQLMDNMNVVPQDILVAAEDEAMAEDAEDMIENGTENVAEDEGEVEDEGVHEDVATDHMINMMEEVVENATDGENKHTAADTHMETQDNVLKEEEYENDVHTDNDMSQYVEEEALSETQASEDQNVDANELKEKSGEIALPELPIATEQVSTPSAFVGYDDIADNHEVLSPATTAAINEQINNMDNDNDLLPESQKTGQVDETGTITETQELQMAHSSADSDDGANDVMADSVSTTEHQVMDDEIVAAAADASDDHDFPYFPEANEEQEQTDFQEDVSEEHVQTGEVESISMQGNTTVAQEANVANAKDNVIPAHNEDIQETESVEQVLSNVQEVENNQAQAYDEHDDNIPIQVEEISSDAAEQQSLELANHEAGDDHGVEQELAESNEVSSDTIEDVLSGDLNESGHNLKIEDAPQNESFEQENATAKDQDIEENEKQEGDYTLQEHVSDESQVIPLEAAGLTTASEQDAGSIDLLNNKVSIEVDGNALIEEPATEKIEAQAPVDDGSLAPEDDGQLDDYIDADQFDSVDTEQVSDDSQPQSGSTAMVSMQAHDTSDNDQDIATVGKSSVADIPDQNANISDAFELAEEDEVDVMFQTETEQPMEVLESIADNDNQMTDPFDAQASNFAALDADQNVIVAQAEDASMDTEEVTTEDAGMLDMEEINHD